MGPSSSDAESTLRGYAVGARMFGRFTLRAVLGRGGMGVVWRARDEVLGEEVALKLLPDAVRWDPGAFEDLKAETRRARQLTHPNIVRIHDFFEDATGAAIAMEWVDGCTLTALRLQRPQRVLEPAEMAPWLPQLGAALDHAHAEARVVHRDLKPSNLMLTRDGRLKVADFGVARSLADSVTRVSMMAAGTLVYMSPQQAMGEEPAPTDDVYALGATLFELLTGKPPFHTGDIRTQLFQRKPESVAARRRALGLPAGEVPAAWEAVIGACLAKEPARRPATAGEVVRRMAGAPAVRVAGWRGRWPTRRRVGLGAGAVAVVAAGLWLTRAPAVGVKAGGGSHPSDATRATAAWNFDGDARDASGRGLHGSAVRTSPTADRFGRIDRALWFNGGAVVMVPDSPRLRVGGREPFTAAVWLKHHEAAGTTGTIWHGAATEVGALKWGLALDRGRAQAYLRSDHTVGKDCAVTARQELGVGKWHHLALVSDGRTLTLLVDGETSGTVPLGAMRTVPAPAAVELRFGRPSAISEWALNGALDEARFWRRALAPAEVALLARGPVPPRIVATRGLYGDTEDLAAAVRTEFGPEARVLDWTELKRWHRDDARGWAEEVRLGQTEQSAWVWRDGQPRFDGKRTYFVTCFRGKKPEYFLAHDELGGMELVLGSWYGNTIPVLATVPARPVQREELRAAAGEDRIHREGPWGDGRVAVALSWRALLMPSPGSAVQAAFRTAAGARVQARIESQEERTLALSMGVDGRSANSRQVVASFGEFEFTVTMRAGWLTFRAVSAVGRIPLFIEAVEIGEVPVDKLAALEVTGVPAAGPLTATVTVE